MADPFFFQSLTRGVDIGANSYLLQLGGSRIVLDAGIHPKINGIGTLPDFDLLSYDTTDAILVSHAHLDHIGALPVLCRQQPNAEVFMTPETLELGDALIHNSINVMTAQRDELGISEYPFFGHREVDQMRVSWFSQQINREFRIGRDREIECRFRPAGHVLGAAGIRLEVAGRSIFYTGDVHFEDQTICRGANFSEEDRADVLIIETTRGDSERLAGYTRADEVTRLIASISESLAEGGSVLIPVFAMGKTQELLMALHLMRETGQLARSVPVQIGGLSLKMTRIYDRFAGQSRRLHQDFRLLDEIENLLIPSRRKPVPDFAPGRIYALSSGMMTEKTVSNRFAHSILKDPRNALLFVGYADPDSPGGRILAADRGDTISLNRGRRELPLNCRVEKYDFSGHAPRDQLVEFIERVQPKHAVLVHGDEASRRWIAGRIYDSLPGTRVTIPEPGERIEL